MVRWISTAFVITAASATPSVGWAQQVSPEVLTRIESIESEIGRLRQENADLRSELSKLRAQPPASMNSTDGDTPPANIPAAAHPTRSAETTAQHDRFRWAGVYVGLGLGQTELRTQQAYSDAYGNFDFLASSTNRTTAGQIELGARFQRGSLVAGFGLQGAMPTHNFETPLFGGQVYDLGQYRRVRATLGLADDRFHVYGTAGVQFTRVKIIQPPTLSSSVRRNSLTSMTYGFGSEIRIMDDWSLFMETTVGEADQEGFYNVRIRDTIAGVRVAL